MNTLTSAVLGSFALYFYQLNNLTACRFTLGAIVLTAVMEVLEQYLKGKL